MNLGLTPTTLQKTLYNCFTFPHLECEKTGLKSYIKRNSGGRWFPQQPSCLFSLSSSLRSSFLFLLTLSGTLAIYDDQWGMLEHKRIGSEGHYAGVPNVCTIHQDAT